MKLPSGFAGLVGEWRTAVAHDGVRQRQAGGFQVALHAHFHLPLAGEAGGIHDGLADGLDARSGSLGDAHMVGTRSMAALAIDPFRQVSRVERLAAGFLVSRGNSRIRVVAEHALVGDGARRQHVIAVVPRPHRPHAAVLGVPGEGKLGQRAARRAVQVAAHVIAGAHHVIDPRFLYVDLLPGGGDAPLPLEVLAVALHHGVPGAG